MFQFACDACPDMGMSTYMYTAPQLISEGFVAIMVSLSVLNSSLSSVPMHFSRVRVHAWFAAMLSATGCKWNITIS